GLAAGSASAGTARGDEFRPRPAAEVLADRLAAALVHHEPGWRLPRHTALARRYNVSTAQIDAAIGELVSRHLIRRLGPRHPDRPDGRRPALPEPPEFLAPGARGHRRGAATSTPPSRSASCGPSGQ